MLSLRVGSPTIRAMVAKYMDTLRKRAAASKIYKKYQLVGLGIAAALGDEARKSLYIKLAKERNGEKLLAIAKRVAELKGIKKKGAYFMALIHAAGKKKYERRTTHDRA